MDRLGRGGDGCDGRVRSLRRRGRGLVMRRELERVNDQETSDGWPRVVVRTEGKEERRSQS